MKKIKLFEEFNKEYKGYLTGSLVYLDKHKKELEKEIGELESRISSQRTMLDNVKSLSRDSYFNRMDMIKSWRDRKDLLSKELEEVNSKIKQYTK